LKKGEKEEGADGSRSCALSVRKRERRRGKGERNRSRKKMLWEACPHGLNISVMGRSTTERGRGVQSLT